MVAADPKPQLHSVETALHALLREGKIPHVEDMGGFNAIVEAIPSLAISPLSSEILSAVLRDVGRISADVASPWKELIRRLVQGATSDFVLIEMVDAIDACQQLPDGTASDIFMVFLQKAGDACGLCARGST